MKTVGEKKTDERNTVDKTLGKYRSWWAIFREEEGATTDLQATVNICSKCIQMGFPWIEYNTMTERWDYLYIERSRSDELSVRWQMFEES
jgi:hypothetical protein